MRAADATIVCAPSFNRGRIVSKSQSKEWSAQYTGVHMIPDVSDLLISSLCPDHDRCVVFGIGVDKRKVQGGYLSFTVSPSLSMSFLIALLSSSVCCSCSGLFLCFCSYFAQVRWMKFGSASLDLIDLFTNCQILLVFVT